MRPTIARAVIYRSRTGSYSCPATIVCTTDTLDPEGVTLGHVPGLSKDTNVHLVVQTPGQPGKRRQAFGPKMSENLSGTYQEWDVGYWEPCEGFEATREGYAMQPAGTWTWPPRA